MQALTSVLEWIPWEHHTLCEFSKSYIFTMCDTVNIDDKLEHLLCHLSCHINSWILHKKCHINYKLWMLPCSACCPTAPCLLILHILYWTVINFAGKIWFSKLTANRFRTGQNQQVTHKWWVVLLTVRAVSVAISIMELCAMPSMILL